ncbi:MAG: nitrogen regulation protein NR(I) [Alphaproteobacteria bacterium CG_4_10_14_0_2_um_filter_63_37]|nr:MAG: nitrogen regulation protein NR(I) [Proteobacteria bacterium CG1_02_64_396]PJA24199.1 MAG: nitrogen regulation protein NR(I) [Alphaproteobacteria bacterium CG_4_10_14_0_2_um_filter_63_37]
MTRPIFIVDDDRSIRWVLNRRLSGAGFEVREFESGKGVLEGVAEVRPSLIFLDVSMPDVSGLDLLREIQAGFPDLPVVIMTALTTVDTAVDAFGRGAAEYLPKPFDLDIALELAQRLTQASAGKGAAKEETGSAPGIIGKAPAMQELFRAIGRVAPTELAVLVHGESGTGKELVAQTIHRASRRAAGPFVAVNMAAIPSELMEAELFGHERGAFTGAVQKRSGYFQQGKGGTLFLDEIGDMPLSTQTRLLRVLQEREFTPVGSTMPIKADVRIVAATHQDMEQQVASGRFREDLFYRLNVMPLEIPPLRDRPQDIPLLLKYFIQKVAVELGIKPKDCTPGALERMVRHPWPGNVRELENMVRRLMVLVAGERITVADLPKSMQQQREGLGLAETVGQVLDRFFGSLDGNRPVNLMEVVLAEVERPLIERVLERTNQNQVEAALMLGIHRNTLRKKMAEYGLSGRGRGRPVSEG